MKIEIDFICYSLLAPKRAILSRLLKFAAMPSALPLIGGLIFSAEGPFSAEIPVLAGFHPPAWGSCRLSANFGQTPA
ncbi:hypothetical protein [Methylocaldum marinum]|uniref:hypothetical protein n=1 Tax=Methylocaldum marinum TaxID=1432792 RepID=UPI0011AE3844|nr:hypothetical protein [Methylocaldum marinum]